MANNPKKKSKTQKRKAKERKVSVTTPENGEEIVAGETQIAKAEAKPVEKSKKAAKPAKADAKDKKPGFFSRIGDFFKGTISELKKVNWLTGEELLKNSGFVGAFVTVFTLVVWAIDSGLGALAALILQLK